MKSKKKFLLLGVGVMGALALGVGATSTFAWFTATANAAVSVTSDKAGPLVTQATPTDLAYNFKLNASLSIEKHAGQETDPSVNDPMELTTVKTDTTGLILEGADDNDSFFFGYYPSGSSTVHYRYTGLTDPAKDYWRLYKVHVQLELDSNSKVKLSDNSSSSYSEAQAIALLGTKAQNNGYTLAITTNSYKKTSDTSVDSGKTYYTVSSNVWSAVTSASAASLSTYYERDSTSRVLVFSGNASTVKPTAAYTAHSLNPEATAILPVENGKDYYFGMYVDGEGQDGTQDIGTEVLATLTRGDVTA